MPRAPKGNESYNTSKIRKPHQRYSQRNHTTVKNNNCKIFRIFQGERSKGLVIYWRKELTSQRRDFVEHVCPLGFSSDSSWRRNEASWSLRNPRFLIDFEVCTHSYCHPACPQPTLGKEDVFTIRIKKCQTISKQLA